MLVISLPSQHLLSLLSLLSPLSLLFRLSLISLLFRFAVAHLNLDKIAW